MGGRTVNAIRILVACALLPRVSFGAGGGDGEDLRIPPDVPMRSIFHNYNYPGIDWEALEDPKNDDLLRRCARGAALPDLAGLDIDDLEGRLLRLERGKLLVRSGDRCSLRFPVIAGELHARLHASIRVTANELLPAVKEMVGEIRRHIRGEEPMLYHLLWSIVMDGPVAWKVQEVGLGKRLRKESVDMTTCWWMYPDHPSQAGTNTYLRPGGLLAITWSRSTPWPEGVCKALCASEGAFLLSSARREPIPKEKITEDLRSYGLVDASGRSALFLLDPSSPIAAALAGCSSRFGRSAAERLEIEGIAQALGIAPERALVIAYHELCYEILGALRAAGVLTVPPATKDDPRATRYLVSLVPIVSDAERSRYEKMLEEVFRGLTDPPAGTKGEAEAKRSPFFPQPLQDEWSRWIVGEWQGTGEGDAGKGRGTARYELALGGQFLICRGESEITGLDPDFLKKHLHASDEEIERFRREGYRMMEVYTVDPRTGEVVAFLFDSLRCVATGRGRREGFRETVEWEWRTGGKSTRITERDGPDGMRIIERTSNPDGSVMEDKGEMVRRK